VIRKIPNDRLVQTLNEETDKLNLRLRDAEVPIRSWNLGVSASVPLAGEGALQWTRRGDSWGLFFGDTSILSASRQVRVLAADALPTLIDSLCEQVHLQLERVTTATKAIDKLIAELKDAGLPVDVVSQT
jgi:hypothetical protein